VPIQISRNISLIIGTLTAVSMMTLVYYYGAQMRFVDLEDIYELRFETGQYNYGAFANYSIAWLLYVCLPFYYAVAVLQRRPFALGIGIVGSLLLYAAMGYKSALFMGIAVVGIHVLYSWGDEFLFRLVVLLLAIVAVLAFLPYTEYGIIRWLRGLVFVRVLGMGGWTINAYYEFFSTNGFTYFTHVTVVNAITGAYPYGNLGLGQVIGLHNFGSEYANFNASFWASDGLAALGIIGIPIVTVAICGVWFMINRSVQEFSRKFAVLWLCGFWQGLLNTPLTVALLSGGGLLIMLLMKVNAAETRRMEDASDGADNATEEPSSLKPAAGRSD
jgi:hypothetical protein